MQLNRRDVMKLGGLGAVGAAASTFLPGGLGVSASTLSTLDPRFMPLPFESRFVRPPIARVDHRDRLPDGRLVVPVEVDGALVWAVTEGTVMDEELQTQFNDLLSYVVGCGLWGQNWGGTAPSDHP